MKLSMSLLAKHLAKYSPEIHISKDELSIRGIRFLSDQQSNYVLDYVYLGAASGYIQDPRYQDGMILVCGENEIICHSSDLEMLINDILAAFDYYGGLEERLIIAAGEHQSLEVMLEAASGILDSPILVFDMEGTCIHSVRAELIPEQMWNSIQANATADLKSVSQILTDEQGRIWHDISDQPMLLHPIGKPYEKAVSMYLSLEGERVGFVMIFPISKNEERLSLYCERLLAEYFCKAWEFSDRSSTYLSSNQIFRQLLSGEQVSEPAFQRFSKEIKTEPYLILLVLQSNGTRNHTIHHMLINEVKTLNLKCAACEYNNTVTILLGKNAESQILKILQKKDWIKNLSVGISMPVYEISELQAAYDQAHLAMTYSEEPGIRSCADYALSFLLQILRKNDHSAQLRHPAIFILQNYDTANHTDLLNTLEAYLKNNCSQNLTSGILHIHLNSLKYRLRRIEELTGIDFKDSEEILYLQLSLKL